MWILTFNLILAQFPLSFYPRIWHFTAVLLTPIGYMLSSGSLYFICRWLDMYICAIPTLTLLLIDITGAVLCRSKNVVFVSENSVLILGFCRD